MVGGPRQGKRQTTEAEKMRRWEGLSEEAEEERRPVGVGRLRIKGAKMAKPVRN